MKRLAISVCVVLCAVVVASAQNFNGVYAGVNLGGAFGSSDVQTQTMFSPVGYFALSSIPAVNNAGFKTVSPKGFTGGGQFGFNLQENHFVGGVELDFGAMKLDDTVTAGATYPCCAPTAFTVTQNVSTDWLFTVRPRLGYANDHWMVYGTAGLAVTNLNYTSVFNDTFASAHESAGTDGLRPGWIAGGGVEYKFKKWGVKGEYLYAGLGSTSVGSTNLTGTFGTTVVQFPSNVFSHNAELNANIVRFGVNYHF